MCYVRSFSYSRITTSYCKHKSGQCNEKCECEIHPHNYFFYIKVIHNVLVAQSYLLVHYIFVEIDHVILCNIFNLYTWTILTNQSFYSYLIWRIHILIIQRTTHICIIHRAILTWKKHRVVSINYVNNR